MCIRDSHIIARIPQHQMDLEPLQQGTHHPLRVEGRPGRQQAGKEEAQEEKIQQDVYKRQMYGYV